MKTFLNGRAVSVLYPTLVRLFVVIPLILLHLAKFLYAGNMVYFILIVIQIISVVIVILSAIVGADLHDNPDKIDRLLSKNPLSFYQKDTPISTVSDLLYQIPMLFLLVALGYWLLVVLWMFDIIFLAISKNIALKIIRMVEKRWTQNNSQ